MVRKFLAGIDSSGAAGALIWSMYFHREGGGFRWHQIFTHPSLASYHWPGFAPGEAHKERELLAALREAGFKIQGLAVPPVPPPEAPMLLPVGDVPMLSWRGSVGASGYDIQRAAKADGPWQAAAENVSDGDVAYQPLWSDTAVRAGQTVYYRVIARNAAGASPPSNVAGPVQVKGVCFVDELRDLALASAKSDGLTLVNDHNGCYAECLYRAKGDKGEWLVYQMPADITSFKISVWFTDKVSDLTLQVSRDGKEFADVKPDRSAQTFSNLPRDIIKVGGRTRVEYRGTVSAGNRCFRVLWTGPAELDRVELCHPGAP